MSSSAGFSTPTKRRPADDDNDPSDPTSYATSPPLPGPPLVEMVGGMKPGGSGGGGLGGGSSNKGHFLHIPSRQKAGSEEAIGAAAKRPGNSLSPPRRSLPPVIRRRSVNSTFNLAMMEPPSLFDFQPDPIHRPRYGIKDLAEAYFRSPTAQITMLGLSISSCILFVIETYYEAWGVNIITIVVLELIVSFSFVVDFILSMVFALDWRRYVLSLNGIIDLISIVPVFTFVAYHAGLLNIQDITSGDYVWLDIGNLCRILRGLKVFRILHFSMSGHGVGLPTGQRRAPGHLWVQSALTESDSVTVRVIKLIFWLTGTIFISSGLVWFIENYEDNLSFSVPPSMGTLKWHDALYFVGVTLATVGFGDITPNSDLARIVTLVFIFFFLAAIPYQIGKLVEAISSQSIYRRSHFKPLKHTEHAIILGRVTYPILASFVEQFLHGDRLLEHHFRLVILSPHEPCGWVQSLLHHPRYQDRLQYLLGRPWNSDDLRRAGAGHAQAIFILADFMAPDIVKDQDRILLTAVAARKYLIRQYDYDHDDGDVDEHEQAMLAGKRRQSQRQQLQQQRQKQQFTSPSSDAGGGGAGFRLPSFAAAKNSSFVRGAADIAAKLHLPGFHKGRDAFEGDQEITDRIVIQTHSTIAMDELTRGLGFRRAYCPHIIRLRLMAYGTIFPGLVSFFINLLRGDPFFGEEISDEAEWSSAFRRAACQSIVRHNLTLTNESNLKGRTFAEVSRYMYKWYNVVLIGVEINGVFLMNPHHLFRFQPSRYSSLWAYFIAPSSQAVADALEAMEHNHWDSMDLDHTINTPPAVDLRATDLPPPRTTLLENIFAHSITARHPIQHHHGRHQTHPVLYTNHATGASPMCAVPNVDVDAARRHSFPIHPLEEVWTGPSVGGLLRTRSMPIATMNHPPAHDHEGMLLQAKQMIQEAHESHQANSPKSRMPLNQQQQQQTGVGGSGGGDGMGVLGRGEGSNASLPVLSDAIAPTKMMDSVVQKVQGARDMLTRLLDVHHYNPMPVGGLKNHVVLGLCNEVSPSLDAFVQYVTAFRKLAHLPIVVLTNDMERYQRMMQRVKSRLAASCRKVKDIIAPNTSDIYFVKGSPKNKADLIACHVSSAYAVVLLGDDVPRNNKDIDDDADDPVAMDRHVLLSCFKLEGILQKRLYNQVLTLVDLRNEVNMDLLRQRIRPPRQNTSPHDFTPAPTPSHLLQRSMSLGPHQLQRHPSHPSQSIAIGFPPCSPIASRRSFSHISNGTGAFLSPGRKRSSTHSTVIERKWASEHHRRPADRATHNTSQQGCPLFAAGRVCCRSFFDVLFLYLYKNPTALKFWKELIRSRLDDLNTIEFQMGNQISVDDDDEEHDGISFCKDDSTVTGGRGGGGGEEEASLDEMDEEVPQGYNGFDLYMDTTGEDTAPPQMYDLQDSIDALRSSLDQMTLPSAFVGRCYGELVDAFLFMGIVPLGLYRPRGLMDAPMPFSIVNPKATTRLVRADLVYVLRPSTLTPSK